MPLRKRQRTWIEGLEGKVKHHARILANRIEHDRVVELRRDLANDFNRFRLKPLQMSRQGLFRARSDVSRVIHKGFWTQKSGKAQE